MRRSQALRIPLSACLVAALLCPQSVFAATSAELHQHQKAAADARAKAAAEQKKAQALVDETKRIEDLISKVEGEIDVLLGQIGTATERRSRLEQEIESLRGSISEKQTEIKATKAEYDERTQALAERVNASYRDGDWVFIDWLLSSSDLSDFLQRTQLVQQLIREDERIAEDLDQSRLKLEQAEGDLNRTLDAVQAKRAEVQAEERRLKGLHSNRDKKLKEQQSAETQKKALLAETKQNIARLKAIAEAEDRESARIAAELRRAKRGSGKYAGTMVWPTPGYETVSSPFGMRMHPILRYMRMHTGIDIRVPSGAKIVSVGGGRVISAGWRGGYGNCVMIDHGDGVVTVYAHMKSIGVGLGANVFGGQAIGKVGSTGLSTGPHLHFEVRVNGEPRNPLDYF